MKVSQAYLPILLIVTVFLRKTVQQNTTTTSTLLNGTNLSQNVTFTNTSMGGGNNTSTANFDTSIAPSSNTSSFQFPLLNFTTPSIPSNTTSPSTPNNTNTSLDPGNITMPANITSIQPSLNTTMTTIASPSSQLNSTVSSFISTVSSSTPSNPSNTTSQSTPNNTNTNLAPGNITMPANITSIQPPLNTTMTTIASPSNFTIPINASQPNSNITGFSILPSNSSSTPPSLNMNTQSQIIINITISFNDTYDNNYANPLSQQYIDYTNNILQKLTIYQKNYDPRLIGISFVSLTNGSVVVNMTCTLASIYILNNSQIIISTSWAVMKSFGTNAIIISILVISNTVVTGTVNSTNSLIQSSIINTNTVSSTSISPSSQLNSTVSSFISTVSSFNSTSLPFSNRTIQANNTFSQYNSTLLQANATLIQSNTTSSTLTTTLSPTTIAPILVTPRPAQPGEIQITVSVTISFVNDIYDTNYGNPLSTQYIAYTNGIYLKMSQSYMRRGFLRLLRIIFRSLIKGSVVSDMSMVTASNTTLTDSQMSSQLTAITNDAYGNAATVQSFSITSQNVVTTSPSKATKNESVLYLTVILLFFVRLLY